MAAKRPVFVCVLALIFGEMIAFLGAPVFIFLVGVPFFCVQKIITKKRNWFYVMIFLFCFVGFCITREETDISNYVYNLSTDNVVFTGVCGLCEETSYGYKYEIEKVYLNNNLLKKVLVYTDGKKDVEMGDTVRVAGCVRRFEKATNFGVFDEKNYYKSLGIYLRVADASVENMSEGKQGFRNRMQTLRTDIIKSIDIICNDNNEGIFKVCDKEKGGILAAVITGYKSNLKAEVKSLYQVNGISHILAISGLHISAIGVVIYKIMRKRFKFIVSGYISLMIVIGFVFMTGEGVSAVRAAGMFGFYLFAQMTGRKYDMLSATSFIALLICISNPFIVLNSGFQMSFGAIVGIIFVNPIISGYLGINDCKKATKDAIKKAVGKRKVRMVIKNRCINLGQSVTVSISINLILMPVLAWNFFQVSVYSAVINLLVVPLMIVVLGSGIVAILIELTMISESLVARIIAFPGCLILELYEVVGNIFAGLPGSIYVTGKPSGMQVAVYYMVLAGVLIGLKRCKTSKIKDNDVQADYEKDGMIIQIISKKDCLLKFLCMLGRCVLIVASLPISMIFLSYQDNDDLNIYFNDVGQGECIVLQKEEFVMMVDGGSTDVGELERYRITPLLKARGVENIDYMVITHADTDHISGVMEVFKSEKSDRIKINNLLLSAAIVKDDMCIKLIEKATAAGVNIIYVNEGDSIEAEGVTIECVHPDKKYAGEDKNGRSLVLNVQYREFRTLLTGDISSEEEKVIINWIRNRKKGEDVSEYSILKVPHHGSKYSTSRELLDFIKPDYAIISCGIDNVYGHPHEEVLRRLEEANSKILRTDVRGQISVQTDGYYMVIK